MFLSGLHILGSTSTGTHGSGLTIPPLAGMIRGVTLVSAKFGSDGLPIIYRIEPTNGMTDSNRHSGPAVLLQDDKTFNAVIVGLCAFGVVYSVTIETLPFYWVLETREFVDWPTAKKLLEQGPNGDILKYHNAEVWMNPYTKQSLITRREATTTPPKGEGVNTVSLFATLIKRLPALETVFRHTEMASQTVEDDLFWELGQILAHILKEFPLLIPFVSDYEVLRCLNSDVARLRVSMLPWIAKITRNLRPGNITISMTSVRFHPIRRLFRLLIKHAGFADYFPAISIEVCHRSYGCIFPICLTS
jgi:hypothetical protein